MKETRKQTSMIPTSVYFEALKKDVPKAVRTDQRAYNTKVTYKVIEENKNLKSLNKKSFMIERISEK